MDEDQQEEQAARLFFSKIEIPGSWRYLGRNDVAGGESALSYGIVFDAGGGAKMRVYYLPAPRERGGLVMKTPGVYNLLLDNKSAEEISEYLLKYEL